MKNSDKDLISYPNFFFRQLNILDYSKNLSFIFSIGYGIMKKIN